MTTSQRDRILLFGSLEEQRAMLTKAAGFPPSSDEVVNRAVNKAIAAIPYFPEYRREEARRWLAEHSSRAWG